MNEEGNQERFSIGASRQVGEQSTVESPRDEHERRPATFDEWALARAVFCDALCILIAAVLLGVVLFPFVTGN